MSKQSEWKKKVVQEWIDELSIFEIDLLNSIVYHELNQQRKELIEIVEQAHDKDFGTYDYKTIAEKVIELVKNESKP